MASIQRARHYARNEQHSVCDQTNQARIHVEGRRAAGIEIWPLQQGAGAVPAEKPGTREPRGCPGRVRRMVCRLCASHISTVVVDGKEAGAEPNLSESLRVIGQDPDRVIAAAKDDFVGRALEANTEEAKELNIFGAPTFVTRGELFWGDDRLDDAIAWHRNGTLKPNPAIGPSEHDGARL